MLDITLLRKDLAGAVARLETRTSPQVFLDVETFSRLEAERKTIQMRTEELQSQRNTLSKQIGQLKARGAAGQAEADAAMAAAASFSAFLRAVIFALSSAALFTSSRSRLSALSLRTFAIAQACLAVIGLRTTYPVLRGCRMCLGRGV